MTLIIIGNSMRRGIYNAEPKHYPCACIVIGNVLTINIRLKEKESN
jgi:hypothetical protein